MLVVARDISRKRPAVFLVRYFLYAGSMLLALLLFADRYWPAVPATVAGNDQVEQTSLDREILRIQSAQRWPQKVVFDTNLPTVVPPQPAAVTVPPSAAATPVAEKSALTAFAEMKPVAQPQTPARKAVVRHKKPAPARVAADPVAPSWSWNW
jgi:hypothetical protein